MTWAGTTWQSDGVTSLDANVLNGAGAWVRAGPGGGVSYNLTGVTGLWTRDGGAQYQATSIDLLNYQYTGASGVRYLEFTAFDATAGTATIDWTGTWNGTPVQQTLTWNGTLFSGQFSSFALTPPPGFSFTGTYSGNPTTTVTLTATSDPLEFCVSDGSTAVFSDFSSTANRDADQWNRDLALEWDAVHERHRDLLDATDLCLPGESQPAHAALGRQHLRHGSDPLCRRCWHVARSGPGST